MALREGEQRLFFSAFTAYSSTGSGNGVFRTPGLTNPAGQFVWKFVAGHETFFEFPRLY